MSAFFVRHMPAMMPSTSAMKICVANDSFFFSFMFFVLSFSFQ